MGSKFSKKGHKPKPPSVCIKPPPGEEWQPPPFIERIFQGHVDFYAPFSPYEGAFGAYYHIPRTATPNEWSVLAGADVNQVRITMTYLPATNLLDFYLEGISGGIPADVWQMSDVEPRSWTPFDTGLLYPDPGPPNGHLRFRVLA